MSIERWPVSDAGAFDARVMRVRCLDCEDYVDFDVRDEVGMEAWSADHECKPIPSCLRCGEVLRADEVGYDRECLTDAPEECREEVARVS